MPNIINNPNVQNVIMFTYNLGNAALNPSEENIGTVSNPISKMIAPNGFAAKIVEKNYVTPAMTSLLRDHDTVGAGLKMSDLASSKFSPLDDSAKKLIDHTADVIRRTQEERSNGTNSGGPNVNNNGAMYNAMPSINQMYRA